MCIFKDKWQKFEPTYKYLSIVAGLTTITKLHKYILNYKYIPEKGDHWKIPIEFINDGGGDCEDFARFCIDVLVRIQKRKNVRFICYFGYQLINGKKVKTGHAVTVFPYNEKYSVFSNNDLLHQYNNYIDVGHEFYPDGLKRMEIRNWQGKILETKRNWIGTF